jgi:hypothetical protein
MIAVLDAIGERAGEARQEVEPFTTELHHELDKAGQ